MITSMIVPLDGSAMSEQALSLASQIANGTQATIHLAQVHLPVVNVEIADMALGGVPRIDTSLDQSIRASERSYLAAIQRRLTDQFDFKVKTTLLDGPIVEALCNHAATIHADLIVMTTHGRGAASRFWLGSVADGLVRQSHVPVLLERPHALPARRSEPAQVRHMLIPLDGSPLAESMIESAVALGTPLETSYTLLHVVDPLLLAGAAPLLYSAVPDLEVEREREQSAQHYLDSVAARLHARGLTVNTRVLISPTPALAILEEALDNHIDLIALATHGRSGLARLVLGSTADKILRGADLPVLIYRPVERTAIKEQVVGESSPAVVSG